MQRKPGFPVANCNIKMPDNVPGPEASLNEDDGDQNQRRQQLINFGHVQWGFNNWSWSVSKQEVDFVDFSNGKYVAGVAAYVSITVKTFDIHRENVGYATCIASMKGSAIYQARKCAVTNALRETLLSFGGNLATQLMEMLDTVKSENNQIAAQQQPAENLPENNQNLLNKPVEPKNVPPNKNLRKDSCDSNSSAVANLRGPPIVQPVLKNAVVANPPPIAKAHPMPANLPPAANRPPLPANATRPPVPVPPHVRPNSNVSFVFQPVMGGVVPPIYGPPPRMPHVQQMYPNYYEYSGPWHFTYETYDRHHGNLNLNFNIPPKNLVVNSRSGSVECKNACGVRQGPHGPEIDPHQFGPPSQTQGCWIKPTIFYDGFWTEQKVKKWVAEQVEKQFPEDSSQKSSSPSNSGQPDSTSKS